MVSNLDYLPTNEKDTQRKILYREMVRDISGELAAETYNAGSAGAAQGHIFQDRIETAADQLVYAAQVLIGENGGGNVVEGAWDPERDPRIGKAADEMAAKMAA